MAKLATLPPLNDLGSLINYTDTEGVVCALGFLLVHEQQVYDANFGLVPVSVEHAERHNQLLSDALIAGLDTCQIGQSGMFYWSETKPQQVSTWIGTIVADNAQCARSRITFWRNGRKFCGRRQKDSEAVVFERIQ